MNLLSDWKESEGFDSIFDKYVKDTGIKQQDGMSSESYARLKSGDSYRSQMNKLYLVKMENINPDDSVNYKNSIFEPKTLVDLCKMNNGAQIYDVEDFLYCKNVHYPINRLITLRRFGSPVTDNIYDSFNQQHADIARLVTFFDHNTNKLEDILTFSYGLKWRQMTSEFETAQMEGDQSGFSGHMKRIMEYIDPKLSQNTLRGQNKLNYDPKSDGNKIFGPVDSIAETNYRDVGLEFQKDFDLTFEYELRSINGVTPEFAMKDLLSNILATTYNDAKFWGGARYYVGERPSQFYKDFQWMNPDSIDEIFSKSFNSLKSFTGEFISKSGGALNAVKQIFRNGLAMGIGKLLDGLGRPSIPVMNSLLSGEPTGSWHLTIGNPDNPIMCIGNLLLDNVEISFPTDSLSYGDFPTKMKVQIKLKSGMPKDRAGIEMMFNQGRSRMYYQPDKVIYSKNKTGVKSNGAKTILSDQKVDEMINLEGNKIYSFMVESSKFVEKSVTDFINSNETAKKIVTETTSGIKTGIKTVDKYGTMSTQAVDGVINTKLKKTKHEDNAYVKNI